MRRACHSRGHAQETTLSGGAPRWDILIYDLLPLLSLSGQVSVFGPCQINRSSSNFWLYLGPQPSLGRHCGMAFSAGTSHPHRRPAVRFNHRACSVHRCTLTTAEPRPRGKTSFQLV